MPHNNFRQCVLANRAFSWLIDLTWAALIWHTAVCHRYLFKSISRTAQEKKKKKRFSMKTTLYFNLFQKFSWIYFTGSELCSDFTCAESQCACGLTILFICMQAHVESIQCLWCKHRVNKFIIYILITIMSKGNRRIWIYSKTCGYCRSVLHGLWLHIRQWLFMTPTTGRGQQLHFLLALLHLRRRRR